MKNKKKKGNPLFALILVILIVGVIGSNSGKDESSTNTNKSATATATSTAKADNANDSFTVEHDEEYYATQDYIHKFLTEKGYEVQTVLGVPNIGRFQDDDPDDLTVGWYAYVKHKGEWTEFVVLLYNGEVSAIRPNK